MSEQGSAETVPNSANVYGTDDPVKVGHVASLESNNWIVPASNYFLLFLCSAGLSILARRTRIRKSLA
jgi:hypothetical protein